MNEHFRETFPCREVSKPMLCELAGCHKIPVWKTYRPNKVGAVPVLIRFAS